MAFNSVLFLLFFACFFVLYRLIARTRTQRLWCLCLGSFVFYGAWDPRFVPLLAGTALLDFWFAARIARSLREEGGNPRLYLWASVAVNLGVLAYFKYCDFFLSSAAGLLTFIGFPVEAPHWRILLPLGISFYTFQSMSYVIDVYRGEIKATERPLELLTAISFFPHLVAGPIIRAKVLLPQFRRLEELDWKSVERGLALIAIGLFKKAVADLLAQPAERYFDGSGYPGALAGWTGTLAFVGQIYGDFSGYTDIAIGISLLLGFVIPPNFDFPFLASSPVDYWRRWHISLSAWIRDYVYQPLALLLARRHSSGPYVALVIAMLAAGLWHGAAWTFVAFGLYWGILLVATQLLAVRFPRIADAPKGSVTHVFKMILTFYLVSLALVFFRAGSLSRAVAILGELHAGGPGSPFEAQRALTLALVVLGVSACHFVNRLMELERPEGFHPVLWPSVTALISFSFVFGGGSNAFIYFQF